MREGFVAAFCAHGESRKFLALNFIPRRPPKSCNIIFAAARNYARNSIERHTEHALDSRNGFLDRSAFSEFDQEPVARPQDALNWQPFQGVFQGHMQFSKEEPAVSTLEPELMVVNDNDGFGHNHNFHGGRSSTFSIAAGRFGRG